MHRRNVLLAAPVLAGQAAAQTGWPDRTIRLVVPFPPGGPTDLVARPLAQRLGEALGRSILTDNRGGAGGNLGADQVAKAAPDGYTLLLSNVGVLANNPSLYRSLPCDATRDFIPITTIAAAPVALVVHDSVMARNVSEFVAWARQGARAYGTARAGSPGHLAGAMFRALTGTQINHVPYRGSAPAIQDLLGGYLLAMFDPVQALLPQIQAGRVRCLAVSSPVRSAALPDVPTMAEAGVAGHEMTAWWALVAPAGTPEPVIGRVARETATILRDPEFSQGLAGQGISILQIDSDALPRFLAVEAEKWGRAVRASGASVDRAWRLAAPRTRGGKAPAPCPDAGPSSTQAMPTAGRRSLRASSGRAAIIASSSARRAA